MSTDTFRHIVRVLYIRMTHTIKIPIRQRLASVLFVMVSSSEPAPSTPAPQPRPRRAPPEVHGHVLTDIRDNLFIRKTSLFGARSQFGFILHINLGSDDRTQDIARSFHLFISGEMRSCEFNLRSFGIYHGVEMVDEGSLRIA